MTVIDAHHHLWTADYAWLADPALAAIRRDYTVDDLRAHLAAARVDRTVLVEAGRCDAAETTAFLALAEDTPEIVGVVGWADIEDPDLASVIAGHRVGKGGHLLVGVRDQLQAGPDDVLDRPAVRAGFATVAAAGLVNELVVRSAQLPSVGRAVAQSPEGVFVLDHLGKPPIAAGDLDGWRAALAPIAAAGNVVAKLSGLVTEAADDWTRADLRPYVQTALDLFGPERLMFGSDWPVCELTAPYEEVIAIVEDLLGGRSADIFGGTAVRVYGLELP
ncbi:amidohydrolase family protein [Paractinoplanes rishiriensis]|uniref:Amidohydrolase n=1 Tax=Paractinoplanes rishiriensis TaxID=1050105 RepID=A0A919K5M8_9ACTN|nr:amidohydrolase family protein [Actinoplanes rishiriensis]GIE99385.1 amidohydrolase [Actinoplanes rishiriensis]